MTIRIARSAIAGVALAAGLLAAGVTASGAVSATALSPTALSPAATTHCVSAAVPAGSTSTAVPQARCFRTFADAVSYATDGAVRLPAGATRVTQAQLDAGRAQVQFQQPGIANSVVLGASYKDTGWTGSTWLHTGSYGCDTDPDVDWQNNGDPLSGPDGTWDNAIGSAEAFSDCHGTYWALPNFAGANIGTRWSGGVMNNAASSIQWS
jgi:hypothetical protein